MENHNDDRTDRDEKTLIIDPSEADSVSYGSPEVARNNM